jgi:hypothetical protein
VYRTTSIETVGLSEQSVATDAAVGSAEDVRQFPVVRLKWLKEPVARTVEILPKQVCDHAAAILPPVDFLKGLYLSAPRRVRMIFLFSTIQWCVSFEVQFVVTRLYTLQWIAIGRPGAHRDSTRVFSLLQNFSRHG